MPKIININITTTHRHKPKAPAPAPAPSPKPPMTTGTPLSDRQCRTAVWLYYWLDEYLAALSVDEADSLLYWLNRAIEGLVEGGVRRIAAEAFLAIIAALIVTPGVDPTDPVIVLASTLFAEGFVEVLEKAGIVPQFSAAQVADAHAKLTANKQAIICAMASYGRVSDLQYFALRQLAYSGFDWQQRLLAGAILNPTMLGLLLQTASWWPSFDENFLAGISEGCCTG